MVTMTKQQIFIPEIKLSPRSQSDGIVLYSMDNYEGKTVDAVKAEDFDQNSYHETFENFRQGKSGDDIYTIITDER